MDIVCFTTSWFIVFFCAVGILMIEKTQEVGNHETVVIIVFSWSNVYFMVMSSFILNTLSYLNIACFAKFVDRGT
jgi:hypothetical protein